MRIISEGDDDPQATFAAVGYALTAWERCEDALSVLYTILDNTPGELEKLKSYGRDGKSLQYRLDIVRQKGEAYFVSHCDQSLEGDLAAIIQDFLALSPLRHQIAHGIVQAVQHCGPTEDHIWQPSTIRHHLRAPWFAEERLKTGFGYGSAEILAIASDFTRLEGRMEALANALF